MKVESAQKIISHRNQYRVRVKISNLDRLGMMYQISTLCPGSENAVPYLIRKVDITLLPVNGVKIVSVGKGGCTHLRCYHSQKKGQQPKAGLIISSNYLEHFEASLSPAEHLREDPSIIYEAIFIMYQN